LKYRRPWPAFPYIYIYNIISIGSMGRKPFSCLFSMHDLKSFCSKTTRSYYFKQSTIVTRVTNTRFARVCLIMFGTCKKCPFHGHFLHVPLPPVVIVLVAYLFGLDQTKENNKYLLCRFHRHKYSLASEATFGCNSRAAAGGRTPPFAGGSHPKCAYEIRKSLHYSTLRP